MPQDLCVTVVAGSFEASPSFGPLPDNYVKKVVDILPIDLPIELAGTVRSRSPWGQVPTAIAHAVLFICPCGVVVVIQAIMDEDYWRRRCFARWKNLEAGPRNRGGRSLMY